MIRYKCLPVDQLSHEQAAAWCRLQSENPCFDSPFFRPEFSQLVAEVRTGCNVVLMEDDGVPVGFLPFHRHRSNSARPIADTLTDFQGAVVREDLRWDAKQLLSDCGLSVLHFDRAITCQQPLQPHAWHGNASPYIEVGGGMEAYRENRRAGNSGLLRRIEQKARKISREHGTINLEPHCVDDAVFAQLLRWKTGQYYRRRTRNVLATRWTIEFLDRIRKFQSDRLAGVLSVLRVGERIAAIHLGVRTGRTLHCWFLSYNPLLSRYSPGLMLFVELIRAAPAMGVDRLDLGAGSEPYKRRLMTGTTPVANVCVDLRPLMRPVYWAWMSTYDYVRTSRLRTPARFVKLRAEALHTAVSGTMDGEPKISSPLQMEGDS